jgi:acetyltransferase-like isoleucine patch superfamily enzyme
MPIALEPTALDRIARARIVFGHQTVGESVGESLLTGIAELLAPRPLEWTLAKLGRSGDPVGKMDAFRALMRGRTRSADIALFKLCHTDFDARTDADALFARYQATMSELRRALPGTRFVHVTAPLTAVASGPKAWLARGLGRAVRGQAENQRRHAYNERMRATFAGREPLFDLAALGAGAPLSPGGVPHLSAQLTDDGGHLNGRGRALVAGRLLSLLDELTADARDRRGLHGKVWVHGGGRLTVGDRTRFDAGAAGIELRVEKGATLMIGDDVVIEAGTSIETVDRIVIGDGCHIGKGCTLRDGALRRVGADGTARGASTRLVLEPGVTLDDHVALQPGAWLEHGVHVGTGAVVSGRVPAGTTIEARPVDPSRQREMADPDETRERDGGSRGAVASRRAASGARDRVSRRPARAPRVRRRRRRLRHGTPAGGSARRPDRRGTRRSLRRRR